MATLKRDLKKVFCGAFLLLPALVYAQRGVYDRVVGIAYANNNGPDYQFSDEYLFNHFDKVKPGVTAVVPFLLNVEDASVYDTTIKNLTQRGITMIPAIGNNDPGRIDSRYFKDIAAGYRKYTDYIRLELVAQYLDAANSRVQIQNMIDYCNGTLGFKHIMLNPWPRINGSSDVVPFKGAAVDSTILPVILDFDRDTLQINMSNPENWYPGSPTRINAVRKIRPNADILINYENAPQQQALAKLTVKQQIRAMTTTITQINKQPALDLHWNAPFSPNYQPIEIGTWPFIVRQLSRM